MELAIIIGKTCKDVKPAEALDYVLGSADVAWSRAALHSQESHINPWPRYFWRLSRDTSFYRDALPKYALLFRGIFETVPWNRQPPQEIR